MYDLDALKAGVDLLALIEKDVHLKHVATTNGGEWAGPCPFCPDGGVDRFRVWPNEPNDHGRWWCRRCGRGGDVITYVQERDGLGDRDVKGALRALGVDVDAIPSSGSRRRAAQPAVPAVSDVDPPSAAWQARARAFVEYARAQLWGDAGQGARAYLAEVRGLHEETIRHFGLGYNPQCVHDRKVARWGLGDGGSVYLSRGIVLPCEIEGSLWYVQVRRPYIKPDDPEWSDVLLAYIGGDVPAWQPKDKYWAVRGGEGKGLFGADGLTGREMVLFCEGEFDAMLAHQELRDQVDVVTLGGASKGNQGLPGRWLLRLLPYKAILAAYDADAPGQAGAVRLAEHSRRVHLAAVPQFGDLVGFWQAGGDLRAWLGAELARLK